MLLAEEFLDTETIEEEHADYCCDEYGGEHRLLGIILLHNFLPNIICPVNNQIVQLRVNILLLFTLDHVVLFPLFLHFFV